MNPATTATVERAIDLLLQSIHDENSNVPVTIGGQEDTKIDTEMLLQVDDYAGAIKSTLDAVQGHLLRRMSALHTEHNRMIPLHQPPIEIFVLVIAGALEPFRTRGWSGRTYLGRLVTLCRVCKRWRDVIRSTPLLWTTIDILDPAGITSAAISRSANHPLNLLGAPSASSVRFWGSVPERWSEFLDAAITHSTRWRSIQFIVASSEAASAIMNAPAPRLQSLEVKSTIECRVDIKNGGSIFRGANPQLRRLGLHGLAVPWHPWVLCDLRLLSLSGLYEFAPTYDDILGILRNCPGLEGLMLSLDPVPNVMSSQKGHPFTLPRLRSITFSPLSPPWALALLETVRTPSVQSIFLDLNFSDSGHLVPSLVKSVRALSSAFLDAQYHTSFTFYPNYMVWGCYPVGTDHEGWSFEVIMHNQPPNELVEWVLPEKDASQFPPNSISIDLDGFGDFQLSQFLQKLDDVERIHSFAVTCCGLEPLLTYLSSPTTRSEWGLPELEVINIDDCYYDSSQLLGMVLARYGESGEDNISNNSRNRPPAFKEMTINHAPGEADQDTLDAVKDIVGDECFTLYDNVER